MNRILNWFMEPYSITLSELKYLAKLKKNTEETKEKIRISELIAFNVVFLLFFTGFLLLSIVYIILSFFTIWYAFTALVISLPMMALAKSVQKKRYFNRRDAYIKNDPGLIKHN
ncbi:hypothetical protein ACIQZD_20355 [Peribacillus sp. NPDC096447]|uniref:hypothetical protein n=1 Tax=Peribacillus sp. NPDC096447 TaxID=3364394 RepID=UPI003820EF92